MSTLSNHIYACEPERHVKGIIISFENDFVMTYLINLKILNKLMK